MPNHESQTQMRHRHWQAGRGQKHVGREVGAAIVDASD